MKKGAKKPVRRRHKYGNMHMNIKKCGCKGNHSMGCVYGLGFIGAVVYYLSTATTFWMGVFGIFKAIFWPAYLVFEILKFLGA